MIYFIESEDPVLVKIGYARDVNGRLCNLKVASPCKLRLIGAMDGDRCQEAALHRRFEDEWVRGEWFAPSPRLYAFIRSVGLDLADLEPRQVKEGDVCRLKVPTVWGWTGRFLVDFVECRGGVQGVKLDPPGIGQRVECCSSQCVLVRMHRAAVLTTRSADVIQDQTP
jgi:Meiotically Up-regulated Gene 113 (MUG113) protein